ncbi:MAG TPA: trypsin-like peptidase domain-containing protein [Polyangiaceae bacterium LLY-WYZ-14_1]|nr:trypsin-like peptidase domain-containing protein [Polyangiaceae bacterium LLY-WYZ-14_1]
MSTRTVPRSGWPLLMALAMGLALPGGTVAQPPAEAPSSSSSTDPATSPGRTSPPAEAAIAQADRLSQAFTAVAESVSPAVVSLQVEVRRARPAPRFFGIPFGGGDDGSGLARGQGSGVVFRPDGYLLTNHHVVDGAVRIEVRFQDGRRLPGEVVGSDPETDLAVIKVEATGLPAARLAERTPRVGEWVVAVGSPFGLDYTVTAGVLSAVGRGGLGQNEIEDYLQTDASINPGNSGGPLVGLDGQVLGINTMIIGRGSGIGFAVPADLARRVGDQVVRDGRVRRAWLGVGFQELTPELAAAFEMPDRRAGAVISNVSPGGPADRAGLRAGDVVVGVDGRPVAEGRDLLRAVIRKDVGTAMRLSVIRDGRMRRVRVVTGERPGADGEVTGKRSSSAGAAGGDRSGGSPREAPQRSSSASANRTPDALGFALRPLDRGIARRLRYEGEGRVVVARVAPRSPAARAGLRAGDVVLEADRRAVEDPDDVAEALADDGAALLRMERPGSPGGFFAVLSP